MKSFTMQNEVCNLKSATCDNVNVKNVRLIISLTGKRQTIEYLPEAYLCNFVVFGHY